MCSVNRMVWGYLKTVMKFTFYYYKQGVIPGGGGGGLWPPNFWPTTLFSGFSHTTDKKVPSEVVLMGSFMSVIYGNIQ